MSSLNPSTVGQAVTFTATVTSASPAGTVQFPSTVGQSVTFTATVAGTSPTGSVQFFDGATSLGSASLVGNQATLATAALAVGSHAITAVYAGDADDATSTSAVLTQIVNPIVVPPPIGVEPIPALSAPLLALLSALLGGFGLAAFRRRR